MTREPLRRIAVFGGGQVALLAATALARSLPRAAITLIETPVPAEALADAAHTSLPSLARLHRRLGLDEPGMLRRASATHRLATRYRGWRSDGADWMLGYGAAPDPALALRGTPSARRPPEAQANPAAALASAERFAAAADDPASPLANLDHALRFDPEAHVRRLRSLADHLRIERLSGTPAALERNGAACRLADGRGIAADLMVDCTGPAATVMALTSVPARIDWSDDLPVTSLHVTEDAPHVSTLDEVTGLDDGYRITSPGRDRTRHIDCRFAGTPGDGVTGGVTIAPGRMGEAWTGNVVAIGDAAATFEPLGWCNLHLATCQVELLLELLPARAIEEPERAEYNRRVALMADRVRDFVALHHAAPSRPAPPRRSATLHRTIETFTRRAHLPFFEEESVPRDLWWQVLAGAGFPAGRNARVLSLEPEVVEMMIRLHEARVADALAAARPYPEWLMRELAS